MAIGFGIRQTWVYHNLGSMENRSKDKDQCDHSFLCIPEIRNKKKGEKGNGPIKDSLYVFIVTVLIYIPTNRIEEFPFL
jgi:hypothetical protein